MMAASITSKAGFEHRKGDMYELAKNPKFIGLWLAIWAGLLLAVVNIAAKINLFIQLSSGG